MPGRDRLSKRDSFSSTPKLPENNLLQSRPFSPPKQKSFKQEETVDIQTQLKKNGEFGYNAAKIPTFAPQIGEVPPIQAEFSDNKQLNRDEEEKEAPQLEENQETNVQKDSAPQGEQAEITPLGKIQEFGYNAAKIPTFAPTGAVPPFQAEFSVDEQLNQDEEEKEFDVVAPDAVKKINIPENIESGQTISEVDRIAGRNIESVKLAPPQNNESEQSNTQEITDVTTPDKIQRKSPQRNKKSQSLPDTLTPLQAKKLPDSGDESISHYKEKFIVRDGDEEESFLQPKKLPSESPDVNKEEGFNLAQLRGSQEVIVQRQPAPQGEEAEMTPAEREAIEALHEAMRLMHLAKELLDDGNYQQALEYFEKAIKLCPADTGSSVFSYLWSFKGDALFELGRYQEAINDYDTALLLDGFLFDNESITWRHRGLALEELRRYDEALQSYQQALQIDPSYANAQNNLRNLEKLLAENPSLRNQQQQNPESETDGGNNPFKILFGALQGEWNENQTLPVAITGLVISLIPVIGQFADARDLAAYAYRIIFKKQYNDPLNWVGLTLSLVGVVPLVGDLAKFIVKNYKLLKESLSISGKLEEVLQGIRAIRPEFLDIAKAKSLVAEKWPEAVTKGKESWNTALDQLSRWLDNIPDILFAKEQEQLRQAIAEVRSQSNKLSEAFNEIKSKIDEILDEIDLNISLPPLLANKGRHLIHTPREQALRELLEEARRENIIIQSDEEAQALLNWAARQEGVPPENYHAVTIGDNIFVRPEYVNNVRVLREEIIHVFQQRAGQATDDVVQAEIEARLQIIRYRHRWGITNDEVREMIREIRKIRETGRY